MNSDSFEKIKPFKLCFNNEIHRISKLPDDYSSLIQTVNLAFKDALPTSWALQYKDADDDFVMLTNDEDFRAMQECEAESSSKSIKIYIMTLPEGGGMNFSNISKAESAEYQVLEKSDEKMSDSIVEENRSEDVKNEICEDLTEQKTEEVTTQQLEDSKKLEPVILCKDVKENSAYFDVAIDYVPVIGVHSTVDQSISTEELEKQANVSAVHNICMSDEKERLRGVVNELMMEKLPDMVELMNQYLKNPESVNQQKKNNIHVSESVSKDVIHYRVTCDGCGIHPVVGICYKCAVCQDFDFCSKCEQTIEHSHPFLKIKDPKMRPKAIITVIEEDLSNDKARTNKRQQTAEQRIAQVVDYLPEEVKESFSKVLEEVPETSPAYNVSFVREICTIPSKITVKDKAIYKTISLKNSGKKEWANDCVIRNISGAKGHNTKVVPLAPGKDFSCIIILENPNSIGEQTSTWSLAFPDSKGNLQNMGDPFTVSFTVVDVIQLKNEKEESMSEKKEQVHKVEYPQKVRDNAKHIKEVFPDVDYEEVLKFVNASPDMTVEELIENYLK